MQGNHLSESLRKISRPAVIAVAILVVLAVPASASHLDDTVLGTEDTADLGYDAREPTETRSLEELYGEPLTLNQGITLGLGLSFHLHTPNAMTTDDGRDNLAILWDYDADGTADAQVTYHAWDQTWAYQESTDCGWEAAEIPADLTVEATSEQDVVVTVPLANFLEGGLDYRYAAYNIDHGADAPAIDGTPNNPSQVHMPLPESQDIFGVDETGCWDSSANYAQATLGLWALGGGAPSP